MKKFFIIFIISVIYSVSINAQWEKRMSYNESTDSYDICLWHFVNDKADAVYNINTYEFTIISYCPKNKRQKIAKNSLLYNNGKTHEDIYQDILINYDGYIESNLQSPIWWNTINYISDDVFSLIPNKIIKPELLKKGKFISVIYYDECWNEETITTVSLMGFTKAYNSNKKIYNKKYICPYCNKEFDNPLSFGGHKAMCINKPNWELQKQYRFNGKI